MAAVVPLEAPERRVLKEFRAPQAAWVDPARLVRRALREAVGRREQLDRRAQWELEERKSW